MKLCSKAKKIFMCTCIIFILLASTYIVRAEMAVSLKNRINKTLFEIIESQKSNFINFGEELYSKSVILEDDGEISDNGPESEQGDGDSTTENKEPVEEDTSTSGQKYNVELQLNIKNEDGDGIEDNSKLKVTEIATNSGEDDNNINIDINIFNIITGEKIETEEDGTFDTKGQGAIVDLGNLVKNKDYKLLIENKQTSEGYIKIVDSLVLKVHIDDSENIIAEIVDITGSSGDDMSTLGQSYARLNGANEDGVLKIDKIENNPEIEIKYKVENGVVDGVEEGENQADTSEDEGWITYSDGVKITENSTIRAKAIKGGKSSEISLKVVNNIDTEAPKLVEYTENYIEEERKVEIALKLTDNASGIVKYGISRTKDDAPSDYIKADLDLTDEDILAHRNKKPKNQIDGKIDEIYENGTYYLWIWDSAGNCAQREIEVESVKTIYVAEIVETSATDHPELKGKQYTSLYKAIQDCPIGEDTTIKLIENIFNENNEIGNRKVKLNLNGYTLNNKSNTKPAITVNSDSTFTIVNVKDDGKTQQAEGSLVSKNISAIYVEENGTLNVRT